MSIALIVLNYNDYETTIKYINFVKKYNLIDNVIIVDNCSTNNSYEKLKRYESEKIDVIITDKNGGYAYGNNYGVMYAKDKYNPNYLIISNPDVFFEEQIIKVMKEFIEENSEMMIGAISPTVINNQNSNMPIAWKKPGYLDNIFTMSIILSKIMNRKMNYNKNYFTGKFSFVDVIPGSFFMIKSNVFYNIKLFDENTFLYGEENILAYKLYKKGYKNIILNDISYNHEHSASIDKTFNTLVSKYNILYKSLRYYNKEYLKTNKLEDILFFICFKLSNLEKRIITLIRNIITR